MESLKTKQRGVVVTKKKKPGRKPKKKLYFGMEVQDAIIRYNDTDNTVLKNKIYLPKNILLEDKKKKPINNQELIGFTVIDLKLGLLGEITYINSQTAQKLIYVAKEKEAEEFCFPMHKEFLKKIDLENKLIQVKVPKELIDLN